MQHMLPDRREHLWYVGTYVAHANNYFLYIYIYLVKYQIAPQVT